MSSPEQPHRQELVDLEQALEEALAVVRAIPHENLSAVRWLDAAADVGEHLARARDASAELRQSLLGSAPTALLLYLRNHVGEPVSPHALEGVAAIRAWARRIRELRAPFGWRIESGTHVDGLRNDEYRLVEDQLDQQVAASVDVVEAIRGQTSKERILEYLIHLSPWQASPTQLERVADVETWRQDIQDLIEDGWLIQTHDDNAEIVPGSYRLARLED